MGPFDYAVGLISILVGLALADVGGSLHKLLRQGRAVRWDGRVILSVTLVISVITGMWFSVWDLRTVNAVLWYPFYLTLFLEFMVLFLVCAACLPDDAVEDRDLGAFYEKNRRYLWSLFALFETSVILHSLYFRSHVAHPSTVRTQLSACRSNNLRAALRLPAACLRPLSAVPLRGSGDVDSILSLRLLERYTADMTACLLNTRLFRCASNI